MVIWKWKLEVTDRQTIRMPPDAGVLSIQMQGRDCCMWAICHQTEEMEDRHFAIYGTGHTLPDNPGEYIATFQWHGDLVFHVFEIEQ